MDSAARLAMALLACGLFACEKDLVRPDYDPVAVCGDGIVEAGESCDVADPGCVNCNTLPGYTCTATSCTLLCGDGVVSASGSDGGACTNPQRDTACDLSGYWVARETDYTLDTIVEEVQTTSTWVLYQFTQTGDDFEVTQFLNCDSYTTGSAIAEDTPGALRGNLYLNSMIASGPHGARHGKSVATAGGCAVSMDRWYVAWGVDPTIYLPKDFSTLADLTTLTPLPMVADPINGTDNPAGATDPDGDGIPGSAIRTTGVAAGVRDTGERYWKSYATASGAPVAANALSFVIPGQFEVQVSVFRVTQCGQTCALLTAGANADPNVKGRVTLSFIGKTYGSPRVSQVVAGVPGQDVDTDLITCANLKQILPHDPSVPTTQ